MSHSENWVVCQSCEDGRQWVSRYGGNDPDVWARECPDCGGEGGYYGEPYCVECDKPREGQETFCPSCECETETYVA
jgi:hypothetical protein